jgi:hypothetical protein
MLERKKKLLSAGALALALAAPMVGHAASVKDLGVAGRALTFLENGPSGNAVLGVVYDPSKPGSVAEKNAIMAALGSGMAAGSVTLTGKPVETSAIGGVSGVAALYVTDGVSFAAVGAAAKAKRLVTVGSEACAEAGACVMGVATEPKVDIVVNRAAAAAVGASFKAAFRMMIHEI